MNNQKLSEQDYNFFLIKSLLLLCFAWGGFLLSLAGFFYASIVWAVTIVAGILTTIIASKKGVRHLPSRELLFAGAAFLLVSTAFSFFSTPTVFTGRDQGSFSEAAIRLSQNHQLEFSTPTSEEFFKLHEPGRAQNFPGFYYTLNGNLITQFSLVYISWLALFFAAFGTIGFLIANGALFFFFLVAFYMLGRLFLGSFATAPMMLFASTSFVFMWFSKFTLSENIALPIAWISILSLMFFIKKQQSLTYVVFLLSTTLLCFTRIEGFAFLVVSFATVLFNKDTRDFIKNRIGLRFFLPAFLLASAFFVNLVTDIYFYKEIAKALFPPLTLPKATYLGQIKNNDLPNFYTLQIFYLYGLIGFFITGLIGVVVSFWKKEFYKLIPFFVVAPTFIYFFDSQITPDHPWMLRRFSFSLLPAAIFYAGLYLGQWFIIKDLSRAKTLTSKILSTIIIFILIGMNLPAFLNYLTFSENNGLLEQTEKISSRFSEKDLVLVDRETSGDGWAMISGPMNSIFKKNAVYFFNTQDLAKINADNFDKIYLISPDEQVPYYLNSTIGEKLTEVDEYKLSSTRLDTEPANPLKRISFPEKKNFTITGKIFEITK